jgi:hypothetical protein
VSLKKWTGGYHTSRAKNMPTENVDGRPCKLFEGYWFDLADSGNYLYVDDPCVVLRNVRVTTDGTVSNSSAMVQQAERNTRLVIEDSDFDGGPHHQRGVQADSGGVSVRGSSFTRFGNAAVEMNDRSGKATFVMDGNYLYEPGGWDRDDHVDGFQVGAGGAVTIHDNTVLVEPYGAVAGDDSYVSNSALGLWAELGDVTGPVVVDHNLLAGGGFVMYLEQKSPYRWLGQVSVTNNVFDERFSVHGGIWGPLAPNSLPSHLVWTGNTWNDGAALDLTTAGG